MLKIKRNKKGFTLIELLVVIAIIGLLATIVLVSLNNARNKANDTKIKADLSQVMLAVEMYYSDINSYPATGWAALSTALSPTYIQNMPSHPVSSSSYSYADGPPYVLSAPLYDTSTWTCSNGSCY